MPFPEYHPASACMHPQFMKLPGERVHGTFKEQGTGLQMSYQLFFLSNAPLFFKQCIIDVLQLDKLVVVPPLIGVQLHSFFPERFAQLFFIHVFQFLVCYAEDVADLFPAGL